VQRAVVGRLAGQVAPVGFEFIQAVGGGAIAVCPAAHRQVLPCALQRHLGFVRGGLLAAQPHVASLALPRGGGRGKAQIEVARFGRKVAQHPHGDGLGFGCVSGHSNERITDER